MRLARIRYVRAPFGLRPLSSARPSTSPSFGPYPRTWSFWPAVRGSALRARRWRAPSLLESGASFEGDEGGVAQVLDGSGVAERTTTEKLVRGARCKQLR